MAGMSHGQGKKVLWLYQLNTWKELNIQMKTSLRSFLVIYENLEYIWFLKLNYSVQSMYLSLINLIVLGNFTMKIHPVFSTLMHTVWSMRSVYLSLIPNFIWQFLLWKYTLYFHLIRDAHCSNYTKHLYLSATCLKLASFVMKACLISRYATRMCASVICP